MDIDRYWTESFKITLRELTGKPWFGCVNCTYIGYSRLRLERGFDSPHLDLDLFQSHVFVSYTGDGFDYILVDRPTHYANLDPAALAREVAWALAKFEVR